MKAVVQRVSQARVEVAGEIVGSIGRGLVALVAVLKDDTDADVAWMAERLTTFRVFPADNKAFDLDVAQIGGGVLLVSNFTVAADTRRGRRPSLDPAAGPEQAQELFDLLVTEVGSRGINVATGKFQAQMQVHLANDGPATFVIETPRPMVR